MEKTPLLYYSWTKKAMAILLILFSSTLPATAENGPNGIRKEKGYRVFIISIGVSIENPEKIKRNESYIAIPCRNCLTDAAKIPTYLKNLEKKKNTKIDTVIVNTFINTDYNIDSVTEAFRQVQKMARADDVFIFYYAGIAWRTHMSTKGENVSYYAFNDQINWEEYNNQYSFTLKMLKSLTDKIAAQRQLIIFDSGSGEIIQDEFYRNFFNDDPIEAKYKEKNRIILCPEKYSGDTFDKKDNSQKGDLFYVISNLPDSLNVLRIFDPQKEPDKYKSFLSNFYTLQQVTRVTQIKVLREKDYLAMLLAIKPIIGSKSRGTEVENFTEEKVDSALNTRKKRALIIATNSYEAEQWASLRNPIRDGKEVARLLRDNFGYEVTTLFDASRKQIMEAIINLGSENQNPYNQNIIYIAGHGFYDPGQNAGYIVCKDSKPIINPHKPGLELEDSYLDYTFLYRRLDKSMNKVVLVTDVCFGGTALKSLLQTQLQADPENEKTKAKNSYKKVLASGIKQVDDYILLQNGSLSPNSPFATQLIEILKQKKQSLSFEELFSTVKNSKLNPTPLEFNFGSVKMPNEFIF